MGEMRDRLSNDPALMGATHFRMRRLKNVRSEMAFHVLAYNIKRMIALIEVRGLLTAIPT
ncbi:ISCps6, transposase [Rhodobacteraceae bacterium KLH11]|nr:ISCps6, transposase [Rhodobacteraceae bacterium KLH11]